MNKDYEGFAFFQLIPCQTDRFENGPGDPGPRQTQVLKVHGFGTEFNQYGTDRPNLLYDSFDKNFFNFTRFWAI
jgi:hypothetical protein